MTQFVSTILRLSGMQETINLWDAKYSIDVVRSFLHMLALNKMKELRDCGLLSLELQHNIPKISKTLSLKAVQVR